MIIRHDFNSWFRMWSISIIILLYKSRTYCLFLSKWHTLRLLKHVVFQIHNQSFKWANHVNYVYFSCYKSQKHQIKQFAFTKLFDTCIMSISKLRNKNKTNIFFKMSTVDLEYGLWPEIMRSHLIRMQRGYGIEHERSCYSHHQPTVAVVFGLI